jgi:diadenosine tetraphosphate (Ap4A) HIT family hydrolase
MQGCMACELSNGLRHLPGGLIHRTTHWLVEHAVGPFPAGTLIVKPERHVLRVGDLTDAEAAELGPLIRDTSRVAAELVVADQVYNCLWSHAGGTPVHIHYVVQPVTRAQMTQFDRVGPSLQVAMLEADRPPTAHEVEAIAVRARAAFSRPN